MHVNSDWRSDGETAVGRALIRRQHRVTLNQRNLSQLNVQFVGNYLHEGGLDAGTEVGLSGIDGDLASRIGPFRFRLSRSA